MEAAHFNSIDYFIFGIVGISVLISFLRGFVKEAVSLAIWVLAAIIAFKFAGSFGAHVYQHYIHTSGLRYFASFASLFLIVLIVGALINIIISAIVDKSGIGPMDRLLGIFFGLARGVLVVGLMLMFINLSSVQPVSALGSSRLVPHFADLVVWLDSFLPAQIKQLGDWISKKALVDSNLQQPNSEENTESDSNSSSTENNSDTQGTLEAY